jgi:hypothetical protein
VSGQGERPVAENPFCSRRVRPGGTAFLFDPGQSAAALVDRLRGAGWRGQIVGPHGSGKSALLAALIQAVEQAGRHVVLVELHDGQRRLPRDFWHGESLHAAALVVVDGYEQLSRLSRWLLRRFCRRRGSGLLVTAHAPVGLPDLCGSSVSRARAEQIVEQLQAGHAVLVGPQDVADRFARHNGNMRETLFDLYDLYEARRHGQCDG